MDVSVKFRVKGRVQGVVFRASTKQQADILGIGGWVFNSNNGDVEGMATGMVEQIDSFKAWLKNGPRMARVDELIIEDCDHQSFDGFYVR